LGKAYTYLRMSSPSDSDDRLLLKAIRVTRETVAAGQAIAAKAAGVASSTAAKIEKQHNGLYQQWTELKRVQGTNLTVGCAGLVALLSFRYGRWALIRNACLAGLGVSVLVQPKQTMEAIEFGIKRGQKAWDAIRAP